MKIAVICHDFNRSNINKLPWKYIYKISSYLNLKHDVFILTDSEDKFEEIRTIYVKKIFVPLKGETKEVLDVLNQEKPDKCIMLLGLTSFLRREFKINIPVYGVFTSPIYSLIELLKNIGFKDSIKYRDYTVIHYLNSIIPNYFVKKWSPNFEKIIFLSEYTQKKLTEKGFPSSKTVIIPVGIEKHFFKPPDPVAVEKLKNHINPDGLPIIMYLTSPLTLRGTDALVKAFEEVLQRRSCKLIFLSRIDHEELYEEEKRLKNIAIQGGFFDSVKFISNFLTPEELKEHIAVADIICIPFKIVLSDIPISILEAMAIGKPIISTNVACIPEMVEGNGLLVPANNKNELAISLIKVLDDHELAKSLISNGKSYTKIHPTWTQIGILIETAIKSE